jgi:leader peptidase (prepilin peptidase)/N-methyltransferase
MTGWLRLGSLPHLQTLSGWSRNDTGKRVLYPLMLAVIYVFLFIFGSIIGSFLNVVIDRLPAKQSLMYPPSHCPGCQKRLSAKELIPVFSYIWLRGRCSDCKSKIPLRILLVEIGTGLLYMLLFWRFGLSVFLIVSIIYMSLFVALSVIDLEKGILPNVMIYPFIILGIVVFTLSTPGFEPSVNLFNLWISNQYLANFLTAVSGAAAGFLIFLLPSMLTRGGMGEGDVKLAALIGLMTGLPMALVSVFISVVMGGLIGVILLLAKIKKRKEGIPFGPFLCLGALITLLFGKAIISWYIGFM